MPLHLVDWSGDVTEALTEAFRAHPEVTVLHRAIFEVAEDTLVSPANSLRHMDGGIDQVYIDFFGADLQRRVYEAIDRQSRRFLPVGRALLVQTGHDRIPGLIVAPTIESPGPVAPSNVCFAMAAFLAVARDLPEAHACSALASAPAWVAWIPKRPGARRRPPIRSGGREAARGRRRRRHPDSA